MCGSCVKGEEDIDIESVAQNRNETIKHTGKNSLPMKCSTLQTEKDATFLTCPINSRGATVSHVQKPFRKKQFFNCWNRLLPKAFPSSPLSLSHSMGNILKTHHSLSMLLISTATSFLLKVIISCLTFTPFTVTQNICKKPSDNETGIYYWSYWIKLTSSYQCFYFPYQ